MAPRQAREEQRLRAEQEHYYQQQQHTENDRLRQLDNQFLRDIANLRSRVEGAPSSLSFINNGYRVVDVWWVDYDGREVFYRKLVPGESYRQETHATHPWVVRDTETGEPLLFHIADGHGGEVRIRN